MPTMPSEITNKNNLKRDRQKTLYNLLALRNGIHPCRVKSEKRY